MCSLLVLDFYWKSRIHNTTVVTMLCRAICGSAEWQLKQNGTLGCIQPIRGLQALLALLPTVQPSVLALLMHHAPPLRAHEAALELGPEECALVRDAAHDVAVLLYAADEVRHDLVHCAVWDVLVGLVSCAA